MQLHGTAKQRDRLVHRSPMVVVAAAVVEAVQHLVPQRGQAGLLQGDLGENGMEGEWNGMSRGEEWW